VANHKVMVQQDESNVEREPKNKGLKSLRPSLTPGK